MTMSSLRSLLTDQITNADVDRSFARLASIQMRLGLFDRDKKAQKYFNYGIDEIDTSAHQQLALEAAHQSIVLLKNNGDVLPLEKSNKTIAVIGPHMNLTEVFLSNYHGSRCVNGKPGDGSDFSCIETLLSAISSANGKGQTFGSLGCEIDSDVDHIAEAAAVAKNADFIVLAMGIDGSQEAEGKDRYNTTLPGLQTELAKKIMGLGKPVILVLINGGSLSLGSLKESATAIVAASYAGEMASRAIADILFGSVNPSGKLAQTWYPPGYVDELPMTDFYSLADGPGRTYLYYTGTPEFAFGSGLSYTQWAMDWEDKTDLRWSTVEDVGASQSTLGVRIANIGSMVGRHTVLLFWSPPKNHGFKIVQKLAAYDSVASVAPGESAVLHFDISLQSLAVANVDGDLIVHPGSYQLILRDGSNEHRRTLTVVGEPRVLQRFS